MANRFVWDGLEEFKLALQALPADLAGEASHIVEAQANAATADIKAGYPVRTGNMRDHVEMTLTTSAFGTGAIVTNTAKHAWLFENGSQARHTDLGANRGSMPAGHVFIPVMMRRRRAMYAQLADLLTRHGLAVSGTP